MNRISSRIRKVFVRRTERRECRTAPIDKELTTGRTFSTDLRDGPSHLGMVDSPPSITRLSFSSQLDATNEDDENSSLVAMASPSSGSAGCYGIEQISKSWIEEKYYQTDLENSYEWEDGIDCVLNPVPLNTMQEVTPPGREKTGRRIRWMSPVSSVRFFEERISPAAGALSMSHVAVEYIDKNLRRNDSCFQPEDVEDRYETYDDCENDDLSVASDDIEMLRISFTPSEDSEDLDDCESPIAVCPSVIEPSRFCEAHAEPVSKRASAPVYTEVYSHSQWNLFCKFFAIFLIFSCISGHAAQLLEKLDTASTIVSFLQPQKDLRLKKAIRRRQFQTYSTLDSPGQFLEIRQSPIGVWLT